MKLSRLFLAAGLFFCGILPVFAAGEVPLTIDTKDGRHLSYKVELAQTPDELAHGLMNRSSVPDYTGMLFDFGYERPISMWMKNTPIPLDMLFVANDGKILRIAQRTVPMSLETIPSPGPIRAVLELGGGASERLNIHEGDHLVGAIFSH